MRSVENGQSGIRNERSLFHYPIARKESKKELKKNMFGGRCNHCACFGSRDYWMLTQILLQLIVD
jgi:hypothetical protein